MKINQPMSRVLPALAVYQFNRWWTSRGVSRSASGLTFNAKSCLLFCFSLNCQWMCLFKLDSIHKISAIQNLKFTSTVVKLLCLWTTHELQALHKSLQWYFVSKIVLTYCEQKIVLVIQKNVWHSRLKAENLQKIWDKEKIFFETECFFNLFLEVSQVKYIRTIRIQIEKNNWDLETCRTS